MILTNTLANKARNQDCPRLPWLIQIFSVGDIGLPCPKEEDWLFLVRWWKELPKFLGTKVFDLGATIEHAHLELFTTHVLPYFMLGCVHSVFIEEVYLKIKINFTCRSFRVDYFHHMKNGTCFPFPHPHIQVCFPQMISVSSLKLGSLALTPNDLPVSNSHAWFQVSILFSFKNPLLSSNIETGNVAHFYLFISLRRSIFLTSISKYQLSAIFWLD